MNTRAVKVGDWVRLLGGGDSKPKKVVQVFNGDVIIDRKPRFTTSDGKIGRLNSDGTFLFPESWEFVDPPVPRAVKVDDRVRLLGNSDSNPKKVVHLVTQVWETKHDDASPFKFQIDDGSVGFLKADKTFMYPEYWEFIDDPSSEDLQRLFNIVLKERNEALDKLRAITKIIDGE